MGKTKGNGINDVIEEMKISVKEKGNSKDIEAMAIRLLYDYDVKNSMFSYYSAYEYLHKGEQEYKKVKDNAKQVQTLNRQGEYILAFMCYKRDPYREKEDKRNQFDCDDSNHTCRFMEEVYEKLWTRDKKTGGDTMNSFLTTWNSYSSYKVELKQTVLGFKEMIEQYPEDEGLLKKFNLFASNSGKIGNFILVPKGFNTERYRLTKDYWDKSLEILKTGKNSDAIDWDKEDFNQYINTFFLWDYVTKKNENEYEICLLGERRNENSNFLSEDGIKQFLDNVNEKIINRGKFMAAMLELVLHEEGKKLYETFVNKIFSSDKVYSGYADVISEMKVIIKEMEKELDKLQQIELEKSKRMIEKGEEVINWLEKELIKSE